MLGRSWFMKRCLCIHAEGISHCQGFRSLFPTQQPVGTLSRSRSWVLLKDQLTLKVLSQRFPPPGHSDTVILNHPKEREQQEEVSPRM